MCPKPLQPLRRVDISGYKTSNPALVAAWKGAIPVTKPHRISIFVGGERLFDGAGCPYPHNCFPHTEYTHAIRIFYLAKELDRMQQPRKVTVTIFHGCFDLLLSASWGEHPDSALIRLAHALTRQLLQPDFPKEMIFRQKENFYQTESRWTKLLYMLCDRLFKFRSEAQDKLPPEKVSD